MPEVQEIIDARGRSVLVLWKNETLEEATWEPRSELMRNCSDLI